MSFSLYDFVNSAGRNEFKEWTKGLEKVQRAKLNEKLDKLAMHGDTLHPHMLTDTSVGGIKKLRIKGNVQLRPLLCNGPIDNNKEYTLLMGAKEVGSRWSPKNAPQTADERKTEVRAAPNDRRVRHERIC